LQERALGGLKPSVQRTLDNIIKEPTRPVSRKIAESCAGTVLIREWCGVRHRVTVLDDAVVYEARHYKSLSAVARKITGAHWSDPLFFGSPSVPASLPMASAVAKRCAIYTRKSSEEGLEQDFNSLHAQRESCEAFIRSQARRLTTMVAFPAEVWNGPRCNCSAISANGASMLW
jgi:Protein of unknown function (DUF2924)